jgi:Domain of unknown function (DUF4189)
MRGKRSFSVILISIALGLPFGGHAADLVRSDAVPVPAVTVAKVPIVRHERANEEKQRADEESGIWGAIAYSPADDRHGFFWGADKRDEAAENALKHCENAEGSACRLVTVFRNHRHWDDDDGTGFPYKHCAALSVGTLSADGEPSWAAVSAETRREAEEKAMNLCGGAGKECKIREWVCT